MNRLLTLFAALVSGCVLLLLPGIAAFTGYQSTSSILDTEAEINARLVSQLVSVNPELWKVETLRLEELLRRRPADKTPERRTVLDLQHRVISEVKDDLGNPLIEKSRPIHDSGEVVGTLRVQRSLQPLLAQVAGFALAASLLAGAIFAALKLLPLKALRRAQDRLVHEATHDGLTGLPNRVLFRDRLEQAMARAKRSRRPMALMFMDLDNFKDINDSLGHEVGDLVLRHVANVLGNSLTSGAGPARRSQDGSFTIARLGGDEFTAIIESAGSTDDTASLAHRILATLHEPVRIAGSQLTLSGSIGIAMYPQGNIDIDTLLRQADMAMYHAKDLGRNTHHFFNDELNHSIQHRSALDHSVQGALERNEFVLHYQPKADLASGVITGVEALIRWQRPGEGLVPPDKFIRALEDSRLIVPVGAWVIATACAQLAVWDRMQWPEMSMAVNLSARQFREPDLAQQIAQMLRTQGIAPHRLELELTESLLMEDNELSRETLIGFARIGVRVAIDDFGTGHSSLAYLKRFKVDTLKIDQTFVRDVPHDTDNCAIATAVAALAHSMKRLVVCEGIENMDQLAFIRTLGCDAIQGFLLARPMPADLLTDWIQRYNAGDEGLIAWRKVPAAAAAAAADPIRTRHLHAVPSVPASRADVA